MSIYIKLDDDDGGENHQHEEAAASNLWQHSCIYILYMIWYEEEEDWESQAPQNTFTILHSIKDQSKTTFSVHMNKRKINQKMNRIWLANIRFFCTKNVKSDSKVCISFHQVSHIFFALSLNVIKTKLRVTFDKFFFYLVRNINK